MRLSDTILLATLAACGCSVPRRSAPANELPLLPAVQSSPAETAHAADGALERTHPERLGDVRIQLESSRPEVVAWAAWRIANERITELWFELRRAAVAWAQRDDDSSAAEVARACLLDALIQLDVRLAPAEFEEWRGRGRHRGALLVLASRVELLPEPLLLQIFDAAGDELRAASGQILLARRSASAITALLWRCRIPLYIDVVEPGRSFDPPRERVAHVETLPPVRAEKGMPPLVEYVWSSARDSRLGARPAGSPPHDWRRFVHDPLARSNWSHEETTRSSGQVALELLHELAGLKVPDDALGTLSVSSVTFAGNEPLRRVVDEARAKAGARWSALLHALTAAGLVDGDSIDAPDPVELHVRDLRALGSAPLPDFEH